MYLSDFETWIEELETYWKKEIDDSDCNEDSKYFLKSQLEYYVDYLQSLFDDYVNNADQSLTESYLDVLYSYVSYKHKFKSDEHQPDVEECIDDEDLRNLYSLWTYELPDDYGKVFSIDSTSEIDVEIQDSTSDEYTAVLSDSTSELDLILDSTAEEELVIESGDENVECILKEEEYSDIENFLENVKEEDKDEIEKFRQSIPSKIRSTLIYLIYKKVDTSVEDMNVRCYVLNEMKLQEILDTFNFEIAGVNVKTDGECS